VTARLLQDHWGIRPEAFALRVKHHSME
jgi:hypothetical protein